MSLFTKLKKKLNKQLIKTTYLNLEQSKYTIYLQNKNKSGIYRWNNIITNESYIGSSVNLAKRLYQYFSEKHLKKTILNGRSKICSSLLKYGYNSFTLDIIEHCDSNSVIKREQYYLDLLKPELNICKKAGSTLGRKHSHETIKKLRLKAIHRKHNINST
jgi:group I intron endonuclease